MDIEFGRHIGLDVAQEGEEFLVTMAGFALGDDRSVEYVDFAAPVAFTSPSGIPT
jgi:hypothetical protein